MNARWPSITVILVADLLLLAYFVFLVFQMGYRSECISSGRACPISISLHTVAVIISVGLFGWFSWALGRNSNITETQKLKWFLAFIVGSFLVFPIYLFVHVWRGRESPT